MKQRGRVSGAALATRADVVTHIVRPDAPYDLTDEEATVWRRIVDAVPADWFGPQNWGDLANYCRHEIGSRRVAQLVSECEGREVMDVGEYDKLLKMRERESRAMASLACRLRISPSSTKARTTTLRTTPAAKMPWEAV